jgi:hypothetical protein
MWAFAQGVPTARMGRYGFSSQKQQRLRHFRFEKIRMNNNQIGGLCHSTKFRKAFWNNGLAEHQRVQLFMEKTATAIDLLAIIDAWYCFHSPAYQSWRFPVFAPKGL